MQSVIIIIKNANDLENLEKHDEAREYFDIFIEEVKAAEPNNELAQAVGLYKIGNCYSYMRMNKLNEAMVIFNDHLISNNEYHLILRTTEVYRLLCIVSMNAI